MIKLLHFADAHIDMANYGRHDPESGLPLRVMDFLKSLDEIVRTAIEERVNLVIFAGDAYKDRSPAPTFQREWDKRIMQLSEAGIPTLLLTGNHDISPSTGRAHALQEFDSLNVPHVKVIDKPTLLYPKDLDDLQVQVLAIPWLFHSHFKNHPDLPGNSVKEINIFIQNILEEKITNVQYKIDPSLPLILAMHVSLEGAELGYEKLLNVSHDFVISKDLISKDYIDYVALGHIHKYQNFNEGHQPPIIYPGSIERVDFGEEKEKKYFVVANVSKGRTEVDLRELKHIRKFITKKISLDDDQNINFRIQNALPTKKQMKDAIVRLIITYKRDFEPLIDEAAIWALVENTFEFQLIKKPIIQTRARLPEGKAASSMGSLELLDIYWDASEKDLDKARKESLNHLARTIMDEMDTGE